MKIKICGLRRPADIEAVNAAGPDYVGFVFAPSKRRVTMEQAAALRRALAPGITAVGVFVNAPFQEIAGLCRADIIDIVQLHGDEDADYLRALRNLVPNPLIKALRVKDTRQVLDAQAWPCDWLLLDAASPNSYGGGGIPFDWNLIPTNIKPFFLAGGLTPATIPVAAQLGPYCLDLSSGVETGGFKDPEKIIAAVRAARSVQL